MRTCACSWSSSRGSRKAALAPKGTGRTMTTAAAAGAGLSTALAPALEALRAACPAGAAVPSPPPPPPRPAAPGDELLHPGLSFGLLKGGRVSADELLALDDGGVWELRRECAQYGVLCFPEVSGMTAEKFGQFMSRFGKITYDFDPSLDGSLEQSAPAAVAPVIFGNGGAGQHLYADPAWHFDGEDLPWLHSFTALFCVRPPFVGHTTNFSATNRAAGRMPAGESRPPTCERATWHSTAFILARTSPLAHARLLCPWLCRPPAPVHAAMQSCSAFYKARTLRIPVTTSTIQWRLPTMITGSSSSPS
eukprot:SAG22_NODE_134_length_18372_cov_33.054944_12_plen_307_part_00